jgi:hypothetical protein
MTISDTMRILTVRVSTVCDSEATIELNSESEKIDELS